MPRGGGSLSIFSHHHTDYLPDTHCYQLSLKINHLLGIGLGVQPPNFFHERHLREHGPSGNILRFLYYPPLSSLATNPLQPNEADVRAGAHSDYGSITLLFRLRGQAGLELDTGSGGGGNKNNNTTTTWAPVPVCPPGTQDDPSPPILVNIGDLLSYWTNGLLRSTVHRVVFPPPPSSSAVGGGRGGIEGESSEEPRYSIAFFCHPVGSTTLEAVPSERVRAHKPADGFEGRGGAEKGAITADEHLQMRLRASYLSLYEKEAGKA